jgi:hypothetical protein
MFAETAIVDYSLLFAHKENKLSNCSKLTEVCRFCFSFATNRRKLLFAISYVFHIYLYMYICFCFKRKTEVQTIFLYLFTVCSILCKRKFVHFSIYQNKETNKSKLSVCKRTKQTSPSMQIAFPPPCSKKVMDAIIQ